MRITFRGIGFISIALFLTLSFFQSCDLSPLSENETGLDFSDDDSAILAVPTGLHVGTVTSNSVFLGWNSTEGASSYAIFRSKSPTGNFIEIGSAMTNGFTDSGLLPSSSYYYKVNAANDEGVSGMTAAIEATTLAWEDLESDYDAMYLRGSMNAWGSTAMYLVSDWRWSVSGISLPAGEACEYKYEIGGSDPWSTAWGSSGVQGVAALSSQYNMSCIPGSDGSYTFTFDESTLEYSLSYDGGSLPGTPTMVSVGGATTSSLELSWEPVEGSLSYSVYRSANSAGPWTFAGSSEETAFTDEGLEENVTYHYRVGAVNEVGTSFFSPSMGGTTLSAVAYASTYDSMYLRGSMNGWGASKMRLVGDYTWSVSGVSLAALAENEYKFEVSGQDPWSTEWGFSGIDGQAGIGGPNISVIAGCSGSYTFTFNDSTLEYWLDFDAGSLPAIPADSYASVATTSSLTLVWDAVADADSYTLYRSACLRGGWSPVGSTADTVLTDSGLSENTIYYYRVSATNGIGSSPLSSPVSGITGSSLSFISNQSSMFLRGSMNSWGATGMRRVADYSWLVSGIRLTAAAPCSYKYEMSGLNWQDNWGAGTEAGIAVPDGNDISYTPQSDDSWTFIFNDSSLEYRVIADGHGVPNAPTKISVGNPSASSLTVNWNAVPGAHYYGIYRRSLSPAGSYSLVATATGTSWTDSGLDKSTSYYYRVGAANNAGMSSQSDYARGTTSAITTTINIVYDVGYGNRMDVRGSLSPLLSWLSSPKAMTCSPTGNVWTWTTTAIAEGVPFEFKGIINNATWSDGPNYVSTGGSTITVTPTFNQDFSDAMNNLDNWTVTGYEGSGRWWISPNTFRAKATGCLSESILTTRYNMSKMGSSVMLTFDYLVYGLDAGEYLAVDVYNGSSWTEIERYTETNNSTTIDPSAHRTRTIDVTAWRSNDFKLRFRTMTNVSTGTVYVDNISIDVTY